MFRCYKYHTTEQINACEDRREDGHCFYCPFFQTEEKIRPASQETIKEVLEKFIDTANICSAAEHLKRRDMEEEYDHLCDAIVIKDHGFNYLKFNIDDERYSAKLDKYPAGAIVQVLLNEK